MRLQDLVSTSNAVAGVSGRLQKIEHLAELLRRAAPAEIEVAILFLTGGLRQGRIGLGWATLETAQRHTPAPEATLGLLEVDSVFAEIAQAHGSGSATRRGSLIEGLFARATNSEQDFLGRLILGELRQGALDGVVADAVARAAGVRAPLVRRATMFAGSLPAVAVAALTEGEAGLKRFSVQLLRPVAPMLADSADSVEEALELAGDAALEFKLDGARIQVHKTADEVRVFSRALNDVTAAVPEVVEAIAALPVRSAIFDGEVIALRPGGTPHPFQTTMSRFGRRKDVEDGRSQVPLTPFLFDCLFLDDVALLDEPQHRRFDLLLEKAPSLVVAHTRSPSREGALAFAEASKAAGHEGVMVKSLASPYTAGRRGRAWIKVKAARTLDLVVLAVERGSGRRRGFLSNLHLGARDPQSGGFVMLGKTFKGLTDDMLAWQTKHLLSLETHRDTYTVYVRPELVVEIAFNEIQSSSRYPGGVALRFARVKGYRTDKSPSEADTIDTVRSLQTPTDSAPRGA